ncbi:MAG: S9 family peptidase [Anaerolineae bacterium]
MTQPQVAPYGAWKSPITADQLASASVRLLEAVIDGDDIYWTEGRPMEAGRCVIVHRAPDGTTRDVIPAPFNARTRVHEYGGAPFTVVDGVVYFANFADQRLYRVDPGAAPRAITPAVDWRYADMVYDRARRRIICVREDHTGGGEAVNTIVALDPDGVQAQQVLVAGNDFYASPRLSPDGARLAWLTWHHPNMPWDATELWVAEVGADGALTGARMVAGGPDESIFQPEWTPGGGPGGAALYFIADRSGWWNPYRWTGDAVEQAAARAAEFGAPQWVFGTRTYSFESAQSLICTYEEGGVTYLARLDAGTGALDPIPMPYTTFDAPQVVGGRVLGFGASPTTPLELALLDPATGAVETIRRSGAVALDPGYIAMPEAITFPTGNDLTAHAFYYPPTNKDFTAPAGAKPPLIVVSHGGPTGATDCAFSLAYQYWTSRGFAIVDVNYGGSTGYGRAYRERLKGQWGVLDVDDCINAARYLVARGDVDGERLIIRGGSAGGYTTLCALTFRDVFKAGASYYGVSDLGALVEDTHKFESRYLDSLIGPYPERADLYRARSPIYHVDRLSCPVIFFQGLEDRVVPPNQAEVMVEALRQKGIPVAYVPFEGEQHGFRRAENIKRAAEAELYFYARLFGFPLADSVEPVEIANLDG